VFLLGLTLLCLSVASIVWLGVDLFSGDASRAREATKSLLPIAAAAIGLPLIVWRLIILNRQTATAEHKTQIDRETHYTSIFSKSVEQLGGTREWKEIREHGGKFESVSRTVPNIEVRLGGIHSLSRLAEESSRDVEKIENTLLSYVRENSWHDRDGVRAARPPRPSVNQYRPWAPAYRKGVVEEAQKARFEKWEKQDEGLRTSFRSWGRDLPETRVDVTEAITAIPNINPNRNVSSNFDECLFVGRVFGAVEFGNAHFRRCTFVRCRFLEGASSLEFEGCNFLSCSTEG
jgi:hypothetical protein